jgi:hypothetical protein
MQVRSYSGNVNRVILVGNVGNVEIRPLSADRRVAGISLATSETVKRQDGTIYR